MGALSLAIRHSVLCSSAFQWVITKPPGGREILDNIQLRKAVMEYGMFNYSVFHDNYLPPIPWLWGWTTPMQRREAMPASTAVPPSNQSEVRINCVNQSQLTSRRTSRPTWAQGPASVTTAPFVYSPTYSLSQEDEKMTLPLPLQICSMSVLTVLLRSLWKFT